MPRPAKSTALTSSVNLIAPEDLRLVVGLGSQDASQDDLLIEIENTARQLVERQLGYSIQAVTRTDYYPCLFQRLILTQPRNVEQDVLIEYWGTTPDDSIERPISLTEGELQWLDDISDEAAIVATPQTMSAISGMGLLRGSRSNPLSVEYTTAPRNQDMLVTAIGKLCYSMFAQQSFEPSEVAKRQAGELLDNLHRMGGIAA